MKNRPSNTVYISNLNYKCDRNALKTMFWPFGKINSIKIIVEPKTNQSRGMAFVEMGSIKESTEAIAALNGQIIQGRTVKANFAIPMGQDMKNKIARTAQASEDDKPQKREKDLDYKSIQLAKKARNDAKRKSNPFQFKVKSPSK